MATTAMDYENANGDRFDGKFHRESGHASVAPPVARLDEIHAIQIRDTDSSTTEDAPRYDRDRSASPRRDEVHESSRRRSMSPNGHDRYV